MATNGAAGGEPNKEPPANGTPSPGKRNASKTKRLLPMELRKRRRAAKLQVSADKKRRVASAGADSVVQTPQQPTSKPTEESGAESHQSRDSHESAQEEKPAAAAQSPASASKKSSPQTKRRSPLLAAAAAPTLNRLQSLYAPSLLNQQRQRQRRPAGGNVPNTFQVSELPLDIVPKSKLAILTVFPYPFQRSNSKIKKLALQRFITSSESSLQLPDSQSAAAEWHQALHYFVHPAASVPTSLLLNRATAASTSEPLLGGPKGERKREEKAFFTARWNTWQEAFRDVYMNFRRQPTGASIDGSFYVRSSDFMVCFLYDAGPAKTEGSASSIINLCQQHDNDTDSSDEMEGEAKPSTSAKKFKLYAVMSQSNSRIRKVLHHLNVEYSMPYVNANETQREVGEFHLLEEEQEASRSRTKDANGGGVIAPVTRAAPSQENMHGADSLLLFHGHDAVHGLYEFLINRAPMSNQDVPELYALHPFANATIQSLQVTSHGRVGGVASGSLSDDQPSRTATLFRTEVLGFCFPSSIEKLLGVLKDEWEVVKTTEVTDETSSTADSEVALRTYMEAVSGAERLNAARLDEQIAVGEKRGDLQQRQKRQDELEFSKRRVEAVVVTKLESRYVVETTTRPIVVRR